MVDKIKADKNIELAEKQGLVLEFEAKRNEQKKALQDHEHTLKMERLEKRLVIAQITGKDLESENAS